MNRRTFFHRTVAVIAAMFGYTMAPVVEPVIDVSLDPKEAIIRDMYLAAVRQQLKNAPLLPSATNTKTYTWRIHGG